MPPLVSSYQSEMFSISVNLGTEGLDNYSLVKLKDTLEPIYIKDNNRSKTEDNKNTPNTKMQHSRMF